MIDQQKVKRLLSQGLPPEAVSRILGCDPSYISQLLSQPDFANSVAEQRLATADATITQDEKIRNIRGALIDKLEEVVPTLYKVPEILAAFKIIDQAKNQSGLGTYNPTEVQNVVQLHLPANAKLQFTLSQAKEVIEVDSRPMIRAHESEIVKMVKKHEQKQLALPTAEELTITPAEIRQSTK